MFWTLPKTHDYILEVESANAAVQDIQCCFMVTIMYQISEASELSPRHGLYFHLCRLHLRRQGANVNTG